MKVLFKKQTTQKFELYSLKIHLFIYSDKQKGMWFRLKKTLVQYGISDITEISLEKDKPHLNKMLIEDVLKEQNVNGLNINWYDIIKKPVY